MSDLGDTLDIIADAEGGATVSLDASEREAAQEALSRGDYRLALKAFMARYIYRAGRAFEDEGVGKLGEHEGNVAFIFNSAEAKSRGGAAKLGAELWEQVGELMKAVETPDLPTDPEAVRAWASEIALVALLAGTTASELGEARARVGLEPLMTKAEVYSIIQREKALKKGDPAWWPAGQAFAISERVREPDVEALTIGEAMADHLKQLGLSFKKLPKPTSIAKQIAKWEAPNGPVPKRVSLR